MCCNIRNKLPFPIKWKKSQQWLSKKRVTICFISCFLWKSQNTYCIICCCITEPTEVGRVRRSLHFGAETPRQKTKTKSPAKKKPTFEFLDDDDAAFQPLLQLTTPSKSGSFLIFDSSLIFKLLINCLFSFKIKKDFILAPETPSRLRSGGKSARKTDCVNVVGESPELKQEGK